MGCPPHSSPAWQNPSTPFLTTSPASLEGPWRVFAPPCLEPVTLAVKPPGSCKEGVSPPRPPAPALRPRRACLVAEPSASNKNCTQDCGFFLGLALLPPPAPPRVIPSPAMALPVTYRGSWDEGSSQRPCWVAPWAQHLVGTLPGFLGGLVGKRRALHTPTGQVPRDSSLELRKHRGPYQATSRGPRGALRPSPGARWGLPLLRPPTHMSLVVESRGWYLWLHASLA